MCVIYINIISMRIFYYPSLNFDLPEILKSIKIHTFMECFAEKTLTNPSDRIARENYAVSESNVGYRLKTQCFQCSRLSVSKIMSVNLFPELLTIAKRKHICK